MILHLHGHWLWRQQALPNPPKFPYNTSVFKNKITTITGMYVSHLSYKKSTADSLRDAIPWFWNVLYS